MSAAGDRWAIVVLGSGELDADGVYRLRPVCLRSLAAAARLAERRTPRAVIFTGYSPYPGATEAEQMVDAWPGRTDVDLVAESTATITAENMARTLPHLLRRGVTEVTLVCGVLHLPRVRYFFGSTYRRHGIRCRYLGVRSGFNAHALAWEAAALPLARRQRRDARRELELLRRTR